MDPWGPMEKERANGARADESTALAGPGWYLVAHCEHSKGVRAFRVDRIEEAQPLGEKYVAPPAAALATALCCASATRPESHAGSRSESRGVPRKMVRTSWSIRLRTSTGRSVMCCNMEPRRRDLRPPR